MVTLVCLCKLEREIVKTCCAPEHDSLLVFWYAEAHRFSSTQMAVPMAVPGGRSQSEPGDGCAPIEFDKTGARLTTASFSMLAVYCL